MTKVLLISVKPEFAEKIFNGEKEIELRKSTPKVLPGDLVIIYSTVPVKAVIGTCVVKEVIKKSPAILWKNHKLKVGIDKKRYFEYYRDSEFAIGIMLTSIQRFDSKIPLHSIKTKLPSFSPPQTFKYFHKSFIQKIQIGQNSLPA